MPTFAGWTCAPVKASHSPCWPNAWAAKRSASSWIPGARPERRRVSRTCSQAVTRTRACRRIPGGASVNYLNPPYGADADEGGKRLELSFLRDSDDWLMPGGVLVYLIPQYRLSPHIARRLATGYDRLQVFRFPDPEYEAFRQIVIFGIKRKQRREDQQAQLMLLRAQNSAVPVLPRECTQRYEIPPSTPKAVWYFRPADVPPAVVLAEAQRSGVFQTRVWRDALDLRPGVVSSRPAMPLRKGHVAMIAVSGGLDNCELRRAPSHGSGPDERLLIKGRLQKVQVDCSDKADKENGLTRLRDKFVSQVVALDLASGVTRVIAEHELYDWLPDWVDEMARVIVEKFSPRHRMRFDDLPGFAQVVAHHSRFRELPGRKTTGLFEAQKHVVAANSARATGAGRRGGRALSVGLPGKQPQADGEGSAAGVERRAAEACELLESQTAAAARREGRAVHDQPG